MYPLNMSKLFGDVKGFAVANDEAEHKALSDAGYEPKFVEPAVTTGKSKADGNS